LRFEASIMADETAIPAGAARDSKDQVPVIVAIGA